jgi:hypothetical protein
MVNVPYKVYRRLKEMMNKRLKVLIVMITLLVIMATVCLPVNAATNYKNSSWSWTYTSGLWPYPSLYTLKLSAGFQYDGSKTWVVNTDADVKCQWLGVLDKGHSSSNYTYVSGNYTYAVAKGNYSVSFGIPTPWGALDTGYRSYTHTITCSPSGSITTN